MAGLDNKITNIIGSRIPQWVMNQLTMRSIENSKQVRDDENITYLTNKSAWVRLVSSVNIPSGSAAQRHFNSSEDELAKNYVLFGGTSVFTGDQKKPSYKLREGFEQTYNLFGESEVNDYGYRPMPGITSVNVETQGQLGSVRAATVNFTVWDKMQLDVMDALYFKLGFTMFLEWGHTKFYRTSTDNMPYGNYKIDPKQDNSELYTINPFSPGEDKDSIRFKISQNMRKSCGNYDAMLGIVTNFNFSMNQEGGFDCSLKLMSLGILAESMRINNDSALPKVLEREISVLVKYINDTEEAKAQRAKEIADATNPNAYPVCVRKFEPKSVSPEYNGKKSFDSVARLGNVNNVGYFFYKDGRYQTSGLSKSGTYECKGDVLYIDGKLTEEGKTTYLEYLNKHKDDIVGYIERSVYSGVGSKNDVLIQKNPASGLNEDQIALGKFQAILSENTIVGAKVTLDFSILQQKVNLTQKEIDDIKALQANFSLGTNANGEKITTLPVNQTTKGVVESLSNLPTSIPNAILTHQDYDYSRPVYRTSKNGTTQVADNVSAKIKGFYLAAGGELDYTILTKTDPPQIKDRNISIEIYSTLQAKTPPANLPQYNKSYSEVYDITKFLYEYNPKLNQTFISALENKNTVYDITNLDISMGSQPVYTFTTNVEVPINVSVNDWISTPTLENPNAGRFNKTNKDIVYVAKITVTTSDTSIISSLDLSKTSAAKLQPIDYIGKQDAIKDQDQKQANTEDNKDLSPDLDIKAILDKNAVTFKSTIECILRAIQVHSLTKYVMSSEKSNSLNKVTSIYYISDLKNPGSNQVDQFDSKFMRQLLSTGLLKYSQIENAIKSNDEANIDATEESVSTNNAKSDQKEYKYSEYWPYYIKYGFHNGLLGNKTSLSELKQINAEVDYNRLMSSYVIPYKQTQDLFDGANINRPVYVPYGFFLMLINHCCTLYEYDKDNNPKNKPLVYVDYNQYTNKFLTNDVMFSTNPYKFIIPFEGKSENFKMLFDEDVLEGNQSYLKPLSGSFYSPKLFDFKQDDAVSKKIPRIRYRNGAPEEAYSGRFMDVLVSIDYLLNVIRNHTSRDETNSVYLKAMIEETLSDMNRCFGNFNLFRLAFNDSADTYYVTDDQFNPGDESRRLVGDNLDKLPLFGLGSIADSLEIRTDVSAKLSNMLAISANADVGSRATAGIEASSFNFGGFVDRFKPIVKDKAQNKVSNSDSAIIAAQQFNEAVRQFFSDVVNSEDKVSAATAYYINAMNRIKGEDKATRSTALIPVALNFSTDGITGMNMGQGFCIPNEILPYTYQIPKYGESQASTETKLGFIVTGLNHSIESNRWKTSVRANMYYIKNLEDFKFKDLERELSNRETFNDDSLQAGSINTVLNSQQLAANQVAVAKFLKLEGFSLEQIAGIMGNLQDESGFNYKLDSKDSDGGYSIGLVQWHDTPNGKTTNRKQLIKYSGDNYPGAVTRLQADAKAFNLDTQLKFMKNWSPYVNAKSKIKATNNENDAAFVWGNLVEVCRECTSRSKFNGTKRPGYAKNFKDRMLKSSDQLYFKNL